MKEQIQGTIESFKSGMGEYCLTSCNDPCCRFTTDSLSGMWVSEEELESILEVRGKDVDKSIKQMLRKDLLEQDNQQFRIQNCVCPAYNPKTKKCGLYGHSNRPETCGDFPLYWDDEDGVLEADLRCNYMRQNWETLLGQLEKDHPGILRDLEVRFSYFPLMCERIGKTSQEEITQTKEVIKERIKELPIKRR
jgi:Fe-S-cluster containining protein